LVIPALVGRAAAKNLPTDSLERQLFSGNLDRGIRLEAPNYRGTQYLGNFCEETRSRGVTRFEGIAFERRRKYRFPKAVLRFPLVRPSPVPPLPILSDRWNGEAFILLRRGEGGMCFAVSGEDSPRAPRDRGECALFGITSEERAK